jgi:Fic family protein
VPSNVDSPKVFFEAPPSSQVRSEMTRFLDWFNRTSASGAAPIGALTRSGIAHLHFESIHPFEDGNGRIGRAISDKCLAQSLGQPNFTMLAPTILARQSPYYTNLEAASHGNEITPWLTWFAGIALEAQNRTISSVEFIIHKARALEQLRGKLNARQEKAMLRMFQEGPQGFKGGLSAGNYATITGASAATTTRDLTDLVDKGALTRKGELRHARYQLAMPLNQIKHVTVLEDGALVEN